MKETTFRNTEIGRIPEDWEIYPLSSIVSDMADGPFGSNLKTEHEPTLKSMACLK